MVHLARPWIQVFTVKPLLATGLRRKCLFWIWAFLWSSIASTPELAISQDTRPLLSISPCLEHGLGWTLSLASKGSAYSSPQAAAKAVLWIVGASEHTGLLHLPSSGIFSMATHLVQPPPALERLLDRQCQARPIHQRLSSNMHLGSPLPGPIPPCSLQVKSAMLWHQDQVWEDC